MEAGKGGWEGKLGMSSIGPLVIGFNKRVGRNVVNLNLLEITGPFKNFMNTRDPLSR